MLLTKACTIWLASRLIAIVGCARVFFLQRYIGQYPSAPASAVELDDET